MSRVVAVFVGANSEVALHYSDGTVERWVEVVTRGEWRRVAIICAEALALERRDG